VEAGSLFLALVLLLLSVCVFLGHHLLDPSSTLNWRAKQSKVIFLKFLLFFANIIAKRVDFTIYIYEKSTSPPFYAKLKKSTEEAMSLFVPQHESTAPPIILPFHGGIMTRQNLMSRVRMHNLQVPLITENSSAASRLVSLVFGIIYNIV